MKISELLEYFQQLAPTDTQAQWDNSGFLVGDENECVSKILVCLDVTKNELELAKEKDCSLIVSHHPVIFKAKKSFVAGDVAFEAARNGINIVSLHTNLDKAAGGVNDTLCEALELRYEKIPAPECDGFLNIAYTDIPVGVSEFAKMLKIKLGSSVQFCEGSNSVSKLGVCSGAGSDFIEDALRHSCDGFITGEASYHDFLDAQASGIALFAAGHFETEVPVVKVLAEKIRHAFKDIEVIEAPSVSVIKTE